MPLAGFGQLAEAAAFNNYRVISQGDDRRGQLTSPVAMCEKSPKTNLVSQTDEFLKH